MTSWWVQYRLKSPALRLFTHPFIMRRSKETSKLRVTCLCEGNSPVTGEFSAQRASNAENVSIWWRYRGRWKPPDEYRQTHHVNSLELLVTCKNKAEVNRSVGKHICVHRTLPCLIFNTKMPDYQYRKSQCRYIAFIRSPYSHNWTCHTGKTPIHWTDPFNRSPRFWISLYCALITHYLG